MKIYNPSLLTVSRATGSLYVSASLTSSYLKLSSIPTTLSNTYVLTVDSGGNVSKQLGGNGTSGTSGNSGSSGTSGTSGNSGSSGTSGTSGTSGSSGSSGTSGTSGTSFVQEINPTFTWNSGKVTRIDFFGGSYKTFTYASEQLTQSDYVRGVVTTRKVYIYNPDGTLSNITQTQF